MNHYIATGISLPTGLTFTPTVVFGFYLLSQKENFQTMVLELEQRYPDISIIGIGSSGNLSKPIPYRTSELLFMYMDLDPKALSIHYASEDASLLDFEKESTNKRNNALLFYTHYGRCIHRDISIVSEKLEGGSVYGMVSGVLQKEDNGGSIYYNGTFYEKGLLCCLLDADRYELTGSSLHDFEPAGIDLTVTKNKGKVVTHIEDEPALEMIEEVIGRLTMRRIKMFDVPFFVENSQENETSYTNIVSLQKLNRRNKSFELFRELPVGSKIKVAIPVSQRTMKKRFAQLRTALLKSNANSKDGVMFMLLSSSMPAHWEEMEVLYIMKVLEILKFPFIGLHTYGEIVPSLRSKKSALQNQTLSVVMLREKEVPSC